MAENTISYSYQFEVLDQGDQVYKRMLTIAQSEAKFSTIGRRFVVDTQKLAGTAIAHAIEGTTGIRELLEEYPEIGPTMANPVIEASGNYTQDKVTVLGDALRKASRRESRGLIDQYVDLSLLHISYGFMERVFKVTANCGVNKNNKVVLIDIGELTFDKDEAIKVAGNRKWSKQEAFLSPFPIPRNFALPNTIKPYFAKRMLSRFSDEAVARTWAQSLD